MIGGALRSPDGLRSELGVANGLSDRRIGVGFISHLPEANELTSVALQCGVTIIAHSFADPTPFVAPIHDTGALLICQVRTVAEAERAAAAGADIVVAQGTEAGGHTGRISTLPLVPAVVDAVAPMPVIAAGGICDARGMAAALMLGADGVWMGTRFEATPEATVTPAFREQLVAAGTDDTLLTTTFDLALKQDWPEGIAMRVLRNRFTDAWHGRENEVRAWRQEQSDEYRTTGFFSRTEGATPAGESVGVIKNVEPAGRIVERLMAETAALLRGRASALLG
jgi:nitronate monooxygenase